MHVPPATRENVDRAFVALGAELIDRYPAKAGGVLEKAPPARPPGRAAFFAHLRRRRRSPPDEADQIARAELARIAAQLVV